MVLFLEDSVVVEIHERYREVPVEGQCEDDEDCQGNHGVEKDLGPLEDV